MSDSWVWFAYLVTYGLVGGYVVWLVRKGRKSRSQTNTTADTNLSLSNSAELSEANHH